MTRLVRRGFTVAIAALGLLVAASSPLLAADDELTALKKRKAQAEAGEPAPAEVPWRNSFFSYAHRLSALTLDKSAEQMWNPYYLQSLIFRPRYYVTPDLSLRARMDLQIELTTADTTDYRHEWLVSDILFDTVYSSPLLTIPYVDISVQPSVRFTIPTSKVSRGRSLILGMGPGVTFMRSFPLRKGKYLSSIGLTYGFRATKYFNEYTEASVDLREGCMDMTRPECQHSGRRNRSWNFANLFGAKLQVMPKLSLSGDVFVLNDVLYKLPAQQITTATNDVSVQLQSSEINHRGNIWAILDLSYDALDWLWLSFGTSTFYGMLAEDSTYRRFFFNRYTEFYFDVTIPVDRFVAKVQDWTGWGRRASAAD